jgi:hypothetical protein
MVCRLYNPVIQSNADQLYCVLLYNYLIPMPHAIGSPYGVPTVQYCLYNHLIPMPFHGCTIILYQCHMPSAVHMVCRLYNTVIQIQCWLVVWFPGCTIILYKSHMLLAILVHTTQYILLLPMGTVGPPICTRPCHAIHFMPTMLCRPCHAVHAMSFMLCRPCCADHVVPTIIVRVPSTAKRPSAHPSITP